MCFFAAAAPAAAAFSGASAAVTTGFATSAMTASALTAGTAASIGATSIGAAGLAGWGTALTLGSSLLGGIMQFSMANQQADAQRAMYSYQAQIERNNAVIAGQRKEQIARDFDAKLTRLRIQGQDTHGSQIVDLIANGLSIGSGGSADEVLAYTAEQVYYDAELLAEETSRKTWDEDVSISNHLAQAKGYEASKKNVTSGSGLAVAGALSGVGSALTDFAKFKAA